MWTEFGSAFIGGVAGFGISLGTPWANWGVERSKESREHQRKMLASWRQGVASWRALLEQPNTIDRGFVRTEWYGTLRGHLSEDARVQLEGAAIHVVANSPLTFEVVTLQSEIDRIEGDWRLRPVARQPWTLRRLFTRR